MPKYGRGVTQDDKAKAQTGLESHGFAGETLALHRGRTGVSAPHEKLLGCDGVFDLGGLAGVSSEGEDLLETRHIEMLDTVASSASLVGESRMFIGGCE